MHINAQSTPIPLHKLAFQQFWLDISVQWNSPIWRYQKNSWHVQRFFWLYYFARWYYVRHGKALKLHKTFTELCYYENVTCIFVVQNLFHSSTYYEFKLHLSHWLIFCRFFPWWCFPILDHSLFFWDFDIKMHGNDNKWYLNQFRWFWSLFSINRKQSQGGALVGKFKKIS